MALFAKLYTAIYLSMIYHTLSIAIDCVSIQSASSGATFNATAAVQCSLPYTLVSCGYKTVSNTTWGLGRYGSFISGSTCYAQNGASPGVYAVARCCNLNMYAVTCNTYKSTMSNITDDAKTFVSCKQPTETLLGCTAHGEQIDGAYPGNYSSNPSNIGGQVPTDNICAGWHGGHGSIGAYSYGTCCQAQEYNKVTFTCEAVWSGAVYLQHLITISCPSNDYFMASCSAGNAWRSMNQWSIENDVCTARNVQSNDYNYGLATAICCRINTLSPTNAPTSNPTISPTFNTNGPTLHPTLIPTKYPTNMPSTYPTNSPSKYPTSYPTSYPTKYPTSYPTNYPTKYPTYSPSKYPSITPTLYPSDAPTVPNDIAVIDITTTINKGMDTTNNGKSDLNSSKDIIMQYLVYIVIGSVFVMIMLCLIIWYILRKKQKSQTKSTLNTLSASDTNQETNYNNTVPLGESNNVVNMKMNLMSIIPTDGIVTAGFDNNITEMTTIGADNDHDGDDSNKNVDSSNYLDDDGEDESVDEMYQNEVVTTAGI